MKAVLGDKGMNGSRDLARWFKVILAGVLAFYALRANGERPARRAKTAPAARQVELFDAMERGDIDVKLIAKSSQEANVIIQNNTKVTLQIELPRAFAGVPILAQRGGGAFGGAGDPAGGRGGRGNNGGTQGGQNQGLGGGFGGGLGGGGFGGGGFGGGGFGGGAFNIRPEKVAKIEVACVCLEHGKDDPHAKIPYEIKPIGSFTKRADVHQLLGMLADGALSQRVAQAAAWHLENGMSFEELAAKRIRHVTGLAEPYFSPAEIQAAMQAARQARARAAEAEKSNSTGGTDSRPLSGRYAQLD